MRPDAIIVCACIVCRECHESTSCQCILYIDWTCQLQWIILSITPFRTWHYILISQTAKWYLKLHISKHLSIDYALEKTRVYFNSKMLERVKCMMCSSVILAFCRGLEIAKQKIWLHCSKKVCGMPTFWMQYAVLISS